MRPATLRPRGLWRSGRARETSQEDGRAGDRQKGAPPMPSVQDLGGFPGGFSWWSSSGAALLTLLGLGGPLLWALRERFDHRVVKRRDIVGFAAGNELAVGDDLLVDPVGTGVFEIGPERRPRGDGFTFQRAG